MPTDLENAVTPGLWRRLAAIFYDSWLVLALWLLGATADYFIQAAMGLGDAPVHLPLQLYLIACPFLFFGWFWTHGGQTLGMRSWRLKVLDCHGQPLGWRQALTRVAAAWLAALPLGLGYLWMLVDKAGLTWHDRLSRTRLVLVNKT